MNMKKFLFIIVLAGWVLQSCDKVSNPFPPAINTDLDTTIYPGSWSDYIANEWPDFDALPDENPQRNVLIEDFTGHNCSYCPAAAEIAHDIHVNNPSRVFIASIHASNLPNGMSSFQDTNSSQGYTIPFWNSIGTQLGAYFGNSLPNSGFFGNPAGMISRTNVGGEYFPASGSWATKTSEVLAAPLKVKMKAKLNYFETPKHGFFLHTEVEKIDNNLTNELAMVVYLIEDSLVGPQNVSNTYTPNYVHRDIMRGTLDGTIWGRTLNSSVLGANGKYYLNYSYIIPNQLGPAGSITTHNAENMHVLIYVYDSVTLEIYQVIKKKLI
jgi:hypothetical protein